MEKMLGMNGAASWAVGCIGLYVSWWEMRRINSCAGVNDELIQALATLVTEQQMLDTIRDATRLTLLCVQSDCTNCFTCDVPLFSFPFL